MGRWSEIFNQEMQGIMAGGWPQRYKDKNIIWILGGVGLPRNESDIAIWRSMATGIVEGVNCKTNDQFSSAANESRQCAMVSTG